MERGVIYCYFQDPTHLATKIRNRMLSRNATLIMGDQLVSLDVLRRILRSSSKLFHGLVSSDLNPKDHQNYSSCVRISRDEIFEVLDTIEDSNATAIYIRLLRSIIDGYINKSTPLLDRVFHAWTSVFLSRLWLVWIDKFGKKKLDQFLVETTKDWDCPPRIAKSSTQQYFLTPQALYSIELNAHSFIYLIMLVIDGKLPPEVLCIDNFHSQPCESIFRTARTFSSSCSSGVNFTVLQFMNLTDKLSLYQKIKNDHERSIAPLLRFPVHHKNKSDHSSPAHVPTLTSLPTVAEIEETVARAFEKASGYLEQVGIMPFLRKVGLADITRLNDRVRVLFDGKEILDHFSQDAYDESDDEKFYATQSDDSATDSESEDEEACSILRKHDEPDSLQPTFHAMRVSDTVPPHLLPSYFKVRINESDKFIHKSSACWALTKKKSKTFG